MMKFKLILCALILGCYAYSQSIASVYFAKDDDQLNPQSQLKLDSLSNLKSNIIFRIYGNCDPSGSSTYNKILSEKRARSVTQYLRKNLPKNIKIKSALGLGDSKQINDNSSEELREKNRRVDIFIEKMLSPNENISRRTLPNFFETPISKIALKDTLELADVNFIGNRHFWLPKAEPQVQRLAKIMKENPKLEIELQGHICCDYENFDGKDIDDNTYNLSFTRANAIKQYLIKQGIYEKRVRAVGLGHLNPAVYPEKTDEDQVRNRRVEIVILRK